MQFYIDQGSRVAQGPYPSKQCAEDHLTLSGYEPVEGETDVWGCPASYIWMVHRPADRVRIVDNLNGFILLMHPSVFNDSYKIL